MIKYLSKSLFETSKSASPENRKNRIKNVTCQPNEDFFNFGRSYFDGGTGALSYGRYIYDGRYKNSVEELVALFELKEDAKILELGCAKGFILYEFFKLGLNDVTGIDISDYAILSAPEEIRSKLILGNVAEFPKIFKGGEKFNFIYSKEMLPHLSFDELKDFFRYIPRLLCDETVLYLEIQTAKDVDSLNAIRDFDPTHKTLIPPDEWKRVISTELANIQSPVLIYLKELF